MADPDKPADSADAPVESIRVGREPRPLSQQVGRIAMLVAAGLFFVFAVVNARYVDFSWVFGETFVREVRGERTGGGVPLIVLLLGAFLLGSVVGAGAMARRQTRKSVRRATKRTGEPKPKDKR